MLALVALYQQRCAEFDAGMLRAKNAAAVRPTLQGACVLLLLGPVALRRLHQPLVSRAAALEQGRRS